MNGPAVVPASNAAVSGGEGGLSAQQQNSMKIAMAARWLVKNSHPFGQRNIELYNKICLVLAREIDYAVAKNEVPGHASILPPVLLQVCCRNYESTTVQAAIMVLMISVKNACKMGWFTAKDTEELLALTSEVGRYFGTISEFTNEAKDFMPIVSSVMSRFYPQFKLGHILASLEVKPGYTTCMVDFHISKNVSYSQMDSIRLFVATKDNIDTSSCIVNPPQVSFLLNGTGVKCRTNEFVDQGPQPPTNVEALLKYGTNLLQAVGQSNGHYIILVAFMGIIPFLELPTPQDYVQLDLTSSDFEIVEGPSRICINCPISFQRIRTPVKGYLCKHYPCFDMSNYLEVNFKQRPSWRCPLCNQSVCFTDLRVDQNLVKILREVGENVYEVIISADGSWTAASGNKCNDQLQDMKSTNPPEGNNPSDHSGNVYDLTEQDNGMDTVDRCEAPDMKPVIPNIQGVPTNSSLPQTTRFMNEFNRYPSLQVENVRPSGTSLNETRGAIYNMRSEEQLLGNNFEAMNGNSEVSQHHNNFQGTNYPISSMAQGQFSVSNGLQSQEVVHGQSNIRGPLIPRNVNRIPSAIQALPVQIPSTSAQQHFRPSVSIHERQRQIQQSCMRPVNLPHMTETPQHNHSASQVAGLSTHNLNIRMPRTLSQPPHLMRSFQVPQNNHHQQARVSLGGIGNTPSTVQMRQPQQQQQQPVSGQTQSSMRTGSSFPLNSEGRPMPQTVTGTDCLIDRQTEQNWRPVQMRQPQQQQPVPSQTQSMRTCSSFPLNSEGMPMPQAVSGTDCLIDRQTEQNWRPAGRMRGALTGHAYSAALSQLLGQSTHPVQQAPIPQPPISASFPLTTVLASRMNARAQAPNQSSMVNPTGFSGSATTQPGHQGAYRC